MSAARVSRWPLVAAAVVSVLLLIPQAQATHQPGFGHDNPLFTGVRTSTSCNISGFSCLRVDTLSSTAGFAITGNDAGTTGGGVLGSTTATTSAPGVEGRHTGNGTGPGVYGDTFSTSSSAVGVLGEIVRTAPGSFSAAVRGKNNGTGGSGIGVWGSHAGSGWGGYFSSGTNGIGVRADAGEGGDGISASSGSGPSLGYGVTAFTRSSAENAAGVRGFISSTAVNAAGVRGTNDALGCCGIGVIGQHAGAGIGVSGTSPSGTGVDGSSTSGTGVRARSSSGPALRVEGRSYFQSGNVGIGISSPVSKLQVVGNYVQLPTRTGAPPATDCNEAKEAGRLVVRTDGTPSLYVCRGTNGWRGL